MSSSSDTSTTELAKSKLDPERERRVGKWLIYPTDPTPPIPTWRQFAWSYTHDDYDGAEDACDPRHGYAASPEACLTEIEFYEQENPERESSAPDAAHAAGNAPSGNVLALLLAMSVAREFADAVARGAYPMALRSFASLFAEDCRASAEAIQALPWQPRDQPADGASSGEEP